MKRNILVIDDDSDLDLICNDYEELFNIIKTNDELTMHTELKFTTCKSIVEAVSLLKTSDKVFDVLLVDYDFNDNSDGLLRNGIELIQEIRNSFNKRVQILFYTMHPLSEISKEEYYILLNQGITNFILKDAINIERSLTLPLVQHFNPSDQIVVEAIYHALIKYSQSDNPIITGLELFLNRYKKISSSSYIEINSNKYSVDEIIRAIRLDEEIGRRYIEMVISQSLMSTVINDEVEEILEW